ncbi:TraB/GumN family protein [Lysobacter fragariae]
MKHRRPLRNRVAASLSACVLLAFAANAAQTVPAAGMPAAKQAATAAEAASTPPRPVMWKVSDKDNAIYLLGSFHMLKSSDYPLSADVDRAFADAEKLVFEVPPADLLNPENGPKMIAAASYGDDRKLSTVLPADLRQKVTALLGEAAMTQMDGYEPWFVNLSLVLGVAQTMGYQADQGLDLHLMKRAQEAGKPTQGLETMDEQLKVLDSSPMSEQISGLQDLIEHPRDMVEMFNGMHESWRNADIDGLYALVVKEMETKTPETYRRINVERNDAWVPMLSRMLDAPGKDDTLVVVGVMHLLGKDGVVEKLRAKGYKVERICSDCTRAAR